MTRRFQFSLARLFGAVTFVALFAWMLSGPDRDWTKLPWTNIVGFELTRWSILGAGIGCIFGRPILFASVAALAVLLWFVVAIGGLMMLPNIRP